MTQYSTANYVLFLASAVVFSFFLIGFVLLLLRSVQRDRKAKKLEWKRLLQRRRKAISAGQRRQLSESFKESQDQNGQTSPSDHRLDGGSQNL